MGLFSNNKKPCPICGNATPCLLPTKVEGVPICKECDKKIDLPNGVLDSMTLDDFRRYIDFYNKNQVLRERFHPEYRFEPIIEYDPRSAGAEHYMMLADEVIENDYYR